MALRTSSRRSPRPLSSLRKSASSSLSLSTILCTPRPSSPPTTSDRQLPLFSPSVFDLPRCSCSTKSTSKQSLAASSLSPYRRLRYNRRLQTRANPSRTRTKTTPLPVDAVATTWSTCYPLSPQVTNSSPLLFPYPRLATTPTLRRLLGARYLPRPRRTG